MSKSISILGSTGSIGLSTLELLSKKKFSFKINILSANKNYSLICKQILKFKPKVFIVDNYFVYLKVKKKFKRKNIKIINRINDQKNIFNKSDITVSAIQGIAGLIPTIELIKKSKKILIANKESIICGWNLIQKIAKKYNTKIIPVDSEHFSIMKLLENKKTTNIKKIYLTASGGPFLNYKINKLKKATPKEAIKHPKWNMGKRISINSATLMNKMLELIEAKKLFSIDLKKIEIVIHPESLVHAIVEFKNGLHEFIYHETTMLIPLANAIFGDDVNIENYLKPKTNTQNFTLSQNLKF